MKVIIISDSHDNIVRLRHVIGFASEYKAEAVIHCGDWNTPRAVEQFESDLIGFESVKIPVFGVLGNADIDPEIKIKMPALQRGKQNAKIESGEDFLALELDNKKILVCHYPTRLEELVEKGDYNIGFCGHTHQRRKWESSNTPLVNPGALHRTLKPSFVVYDTETREVEFVDVAV